MDPPNYVRLLNKQNASFQAELKQVLKANFHLAKSEAGKIPLAPLREQQQQGQSFHIFV